MDSLVYSRNNLGSLHSVVQKYSSLVKKTASHLLTKLLPSVQIDDLIQVGMIGLLEAYRNYDEKKGASFETYAGIRIHGSMLDEVRKNDWVPRSVDKNSKLISETIRKVENLIGKNPTHRDIAKALNISLGKYHKLLQNSLKVRIFGFDDVGDISCMVDNERHPLANPLDKIQDNELKKHLSKCINTLEPRERLVILLYYDEELNLKEIGEVLNLTESRVSQICRHATRELQSKIKALGF